jgi:hypothetical protein
VDLQYSPFYPDFEEYRKRKVKEVFEAALVLLIETLNLRNCCSN